MSDRSAVAMNIVSPPRWLMVVLSVWVFALCFPIDLAARYFPGHRPLLLPLATGVLAIAWLWGQGRQALVATRRSDVQLYGLLALFLILTFLSALLNPSVRSSLLAWGAYLVRVVFCVTLIQVWTKYPVLLRKMLFWIALLLGLVVVCESLLTIPGTVRVSATVTGQVLRYASGLGDPNNTALILNMAFLWVLASFVTAETPRVRIVCLVLCAILLAGIMRTVSLGGLIGLGVGVMLWVLIQRMGRYRWMGWVTPWETLAIVLVLLADVIVFGTSYWPRIEQQVVRVEVALVGHEPGPLLTANQQSPYSPETGAVNLPPNSTPGHGHRLLNAVKGFASNRGGLWIGAFEMSATHPWWGVGPANVAPQMPKYYPRPFPSGFIKRQGAHNLFLALAAESGIPALLCVLVIGGFLTTRLIRGLVQARDGPVREWIWGVTIGSTWIATLIQSLALGTERAPFLWLLVAVVAAWTIPARATLNDPLCAR